MDLQAALALAHELADRADELTLARFRAEDLVVETKPDTTWVSDADRSVERAIRDHLARVAPDHAVLGEEFGDDGPAPWRWVVDPIDGTSNYVRGIPVWATLLGLERDGELVAGLVSAPALGGRRWWAARGQGAFADGRPIRVSAVADLADAQLCFADLALWDTRGLGEQFAALSRRVWRARGFGDFWQHMLVAEGAADVACEPIVAYHDLAAIAVIVEEAGGRFSDLRGRATAAGGSAVSSNGLLHEATLEALRPPAGVDPAG